MAESMIGADPDQLIALAKTMEVSGSNLKQISTTLTNVISQARWNGPDSDRLKQKWHGSMRVTLQTTGDKLSQLSSTLLAQANDQIAASAAYAAPAAPSAGQGGGDSWWNPSSPGWTVGGALGEKLGINFGNWNTSSGLLAGLLGVASGAKIWQAGNAGILAESTGSLKWLKSAQLLEGMQGAGILKALNAATRVGQVGAGFGIATGVIDAYAGIQQGDGYRAADGVITAVLSGASLVPGPVGWVAAGLGAGWAVGQYFSGDVPLSKRIVDFGKSTWDGAVDVANKVGEAGGKILDDIGDGVAKAWQGIFG